MWHSSPSSGTTPLKLGGISPSRAEVAEKYKQICIIPNPKTRILGSKRLCSRTKKYYSLRKESMKGREIKCIPRVSRNSIVSSIPKFPKSRRAMPFAKDSKWMPFKEIKWSLKIGENNIRGFWQKWTLSEAKNKIVF